MGSKTKKVKIVSITFDDGTWERIEFDENNLCMYQEIHNTRDSGKGSFVNGTPFISHELHWNTEERPVDTVKVQQLDAQDLEKMKSR